DFVVPVRADQHQVPYIGLSEEVLDQIERCRVQPLQIVEEQGERMLGLREHTDESPQDEPESALSVLERKVGDRRRLAADELQFGNEVRDQPSVRTECIVQRFAPRIQLGFALTQERTDQTLKRLCERRIRNIALVLIELARSEQTARRNEDPVQLMDDGGL